MSAATETGRLYLLASKLHPDHQSITTHLWSIPSLEAKENSHIPLQSMLWGSWILKKVSTASFIVHTNERWEENNPLLSGKNS